MHFFTTEFKLQLEEKYRKTGEAKKSNVKFENK